MKVQKIAWIAGSVVALLVCLAGGWFTYKAFARSDEARRQLDTDIQQLQKIYQASPFPSLPNIQVVRGDRQKLDDWTRELLRSLRVAEVATPTNSLTPPLFIQDLQHTVRELRTIPPAGGAKVLPDGFTFGFDTYLGSASVMPNPADVPQLTQQLRMVDLLTRELLATHISALTTIERTTFENGAPAAGSPSPSPAPSRRGRGAPLPAPAAAAVATAAAAPYPRQHFNLSFSANAVALDEVLNRLAQMPLFVVVSSLQVQRADRGLRPAPTAASAAPPGDAAAAAPVLSRKDRLASGPEVSQLMKIDMQIDVYTFGA